MRIALIFPPYTPKIFSENLDVVDEEFCLAPPLILAYVAAILEQHGHEVILLDARALGLSKEEALKRLRAFKPQLLGFRSEAYHFHDALEWIGYLRKNLGVPVVTGGPNLSLYPRETLAHPEIDYGIIGEAFYSLPRLVEMLGDWDALSRLPGIGYKDKGGVVLTSPEEREAKLDDYPFPARHLLPNEKYYAFPSQRKNFTIMVTSTGCPYGCVFCAIPGHARYRWRSPGNVVDEIEECCKEFGVREIDFFDAVLFTNKKRMMAIFDEIGRRRLKVEWSCRSRVDTVDKELLRAAAAAGCRRIYYGIESADPAILKAINKEVDLEQVKAAIRWSRECGIGALGFFMVGNPGETRQSVERTIAFAKGLDLDFVQVCRTIAKPGTDLDKKIIAETDKDYWRAHVAGEKMIGRLPAPWTALSEKEMERLTRMFYLKFYIRPAVIGRCLLRLKSFAELIKYARAALKMVFYRKKL
jgi:radical SAM superfamily enzyme YgiQ (UPF0313 family)